MSPKKSKATRRDAADLLETDAPLSEAAARLALAAPATEPPSARVKENLLARIGAARAGAAIPALRVAPPQPAQPEAQATTSSVMGWRFSSLDANEGWLPLPIRGVRMREVTIDRERDTALLYVEMAPGSKFPEHVHSAPERGLVLTGDFQSGDRILRAGDFYEADAGTQHARISSPSGCTGLLWVSAKAWKRWTAALVAQ